MQRSICFHAVVWGWVLVLANSASWADGPDSWPTFRGADRSGVSLETGLLDHWPEGGPKLLWKTQGCGRGYASLAIADGRIYTLGDGSSLTNNKDEYLMCFALDGGRPVWGTKTGPPWSGSPESWQSSRSTPTVDGDRVFAVTPFGVLICCGADDGREYWRKHLMEDLGGRKADSWGYSESVFVDGDRVICTPGGESSTMVALDKANGEVIWTTSREGDRGAGHASIVVSEVGGTRVYVQTTGSGAMGVRAADGKLLWSYPFDPTTAVIPTPIVRGDLVFAVAGYGRGGALLKQVPRGKGEVAIEEIYPLNSALANKHGGVVLVGDYLYGDSEDNGIPYCADLMTGKQQWKERSSGSNSASVVAADGHLYFRFSDGTMVLAQANPKKFVEEGSFKIPGSGRRPGWSHPVVFGGKLYLREQDEILCYDVDDPAK